MAVTPCAPTRARSSGSSRVLKVTPGNIRGIAICSSTRIIQMMLQFEVVA